MTNKISLILMIILFCLLGYLIYFIYQYSPGEKQIFNFEIKNKIPEVNASKVLIQFVPNMRFSKNVLNYYTFPDCNKEKTSRIANALSIISQETEKLQFIKINEITNADIIVFCSEIKKEVEPNKFIAGEGGPSKYLNLSLYPLIISGEVLLYDTLYQEKCEYPIVELHELLHVFGFDHIDNKSSILYPYSSCDQRMNKEITNELIRLYSIDALADLFFKNASASKNGIYLEFTIELQNRGLVDAKNVNLILLSQNEQIANFDMEDISPGTTRTITIQNQILPKRSLTEVEFRIESDSSEYFLENNRLFAKI